MVRSVAVALLISISSACAHAVPRQQQNGTGQTITTSCAAPTVVRRCAAESDSPEDRIALAECEEENGALVSALANTQLALTDAIQTRDGMLMQRAHLRAQHIRERISYLKVDTDEDTGKLEDVKVDGNQIQLCKLCATPATEITDTHYVDPGPHELTASDHDRTRTIHRTFCAEPGRLVVVQL
jgi:hypothetical protein